MEKENWLDKKSRKRLLFVFAAVAGSGVIVMLLWHSRMVLDGVFSVFGWVWNVMAGFVAGLVIAYLFVPLLDWQQKMLMKIPILKNKEQTARGVGIAGTYLLIFLVIFGVLTLIVVAVTKQVQTIDFENLPRLIQDLEKQVVGLINELIATLEKYGIMTNEMKEWLSSTRSNLTGSLSSVGDGVFSFANDLKNFFSNALFAVIFSIYFLYDTQGLLSYWSKAFEALLGKRVHGAIAVLLSDADSCFSGYIRGQLADAGFMAVSVSILLSIVGVPYAVVIGIFSGIGNLIPYVGPIVAYGLTIGVCAASGSWKIMLMALVLLVILQTVDGNVVNPRLLSQSIDVHPVLVIVGLLFGSALGGLAGMLLAVPVAAFLKIQFEKLVALRTVPKE